METPTAEKPPKAMSLEEFQDWIPDEATAVAYFEKTRWNGQPVCPVCESKEIQRVVSGKPMPFRCRALQILFARAEHPQRWLDFAHPLQKDKA